jgi:HEPN domain-containing protein
MLSCQVQSTYGKDYKEGFYLLLGIVGGFMDNREESLRLLREAEEDFGRARRYREFNDWVTVIHYSQLAIEKSVKAIISCFEAYEWTHDPSEQLTKLVRIGLLEEGMLRIAVYAKEAAPWHGRSTYGGLKNGLWRSPSELCREEDAVQLLQKAEESVRKAREFIEGFWR